MLHNTQRKHNFTVNTSQPISHTQSQTLLNYATLKFISLAELTHFPHPHTPNSTTTDMID